MGPVTDEMALLDAMQGVDVVVHLAGGGWCESDYASATIPFETNVRAGRYNVFEIARTLGVCQKSC